MPHINRNTVVFFALLRGGLWEKDVSLAPYGVLNIDELILLAEEQSVLGLVSAGLEQVSDVPVRKMDVIPFLQRVLVLENRNSAMNSYLAGLFKRLSSSGIEMLLVKGQGIAQCYSRPQWRSPGDIDLLLDDEDYEKAKGVLINAAQFIHEENPLDKHFSAELDGFDVELHGTMRGLLSKKADRMIDSIQADTFENRRIRFWEFDGVRITLPAPDNDVIFVFTHILKHFFHYGIGLRQICDWCRLLWTYRNEIDVALLEKRLRVGNLISEWKAFAALAVNWLGMPPEAMPLYSPNNSCRRKANRILAFILETGNFGHNRDSSYQHEKPFVVRKAISFYRHFNDSARHFLIFPIDSIRIMVRLISINLYSMFR